MAVNPNSYKIDLDKYNSGLNDSTDLASGPFLAPNATIDRQSSTDKIFSLKFSITGPDAKSIVLSENLGKFDLNQINDTTWVMTYTGKGSPAGANWQHALRSITVTDLKGIDNNNTKIAVELLDKQGTVISNTATDTLICFLEGTLIATPEGERKVQDLKIGDRVLTAEGVETRVKWVGVQTVSRYFADPARAFPVRIRAGAIAENVPARDLFVSGDHALMIDGVLVQAGALVNGVSIIRETAMPVTFRYFHVETPEHALILAENTPAETFIDNVDRQNFDNWAEHQALYGDEEAPAEMSHPRAKSARQVPVAMRARLDTRGAALYGAETIAA